MMKWKYAMSFLTNGLKDTIQCSFDFTFGFPWKITFPGLILALLKHDKALITLENLGSLLPSLKKKNEKKETITCNRVKPRKPKLLHQCRSWTVISHTTLVYKWHTMFYSKLCRYKDKIKQNLTWMNLVKQMCQILSRWLWVIVANLLNSKL